LLNLEKSKGLWDGTKEERFGGAAFQPFPDIYPELAGKRLLL